MTDELEEFLFKHSTERPEDVSIQQLLETAETLMETKSDKRKKTQDELDEMRKERLSINYGEWTQSKKYLKNKAKKEARKKKKGKSSRK